MDRASRIENSDIQELIDPGVFVTWFPLVDGGVTIRIEVSEEVYDHTKRRYHGIWTVGDTILKETAIMLIDAVIEILTEAIEDYNKCKEMIEL